VEDFTNPGPCPFCHGPRGAGYVESARPMTWASWRRGGLFSRKVILGWFGLIPRPAYAPAARCEACRKVWFRGR